MRISHETIYQSLFIEGRGALKRELVACLRTGRALREPRARSRNKPQGHITADVVLSERPAEADDRAVPGHWEGDLIIGTDRSAIGTLVERSSRSTLLVHLPRLEGWGAKQYVKNGPALGGYGAVAMSAALTTSIATDNASIVRIVIAVLLGITIVIPWHLILRFLHQQARPQQILVVSVQRLAWMATGLLLITLAVASLHRLPVQCETSTILPGRPPAIYCPV